MARFSLTSVLVEKLECQFVLEEEIWWNTPNILEQRLNISLGAQGHFPFPHGVCFLSQVG